jgi:predicted metal-dependent HD superfamily phosphohydrolase
MDYSNILEQAQQYVRSYFDSHTDEKLIYHNRKHTDGVIAAAVKMGQHYQLNERDFFVVNIAAWFHDIGYFNGGGAGHEEKGAEMAAAFLSGTGVDAGTVAAIRGCILATQLPQHPKNLLEDIVCDADLFHLGTEEFGDRNKLMRKEAEEMKGEKISKDEWRKNTIKFLEAHQYHTDYARLLLNEQKHANLIKLKAKDVDPISELIHAHEQEKEDELGLHLNLDETGNGGGRGKHHLRDNKEQGQVHGGQQGGGGDNGEGKDKKKNKKNDPGRGIDTVFRITSNNNQRLSSQADSKAHILIQVNSIIISVLLSLLLRKIEDHTNLAVPAIILLTVNLITIIFSILATRPHIPAGTFSKEDLDEKKVNLLFFGNFYKMSLQEYANGMLIMMDDRDFLYGSLIRDVYFQGIALGNKYRWLRLSYNVFMYGLILSVLAFVIAALAYPTK